MKEELVNIVKKDRKKLIGLLISACLSVFLLVLGNQWGVSSETDTVIKEKTVVESANESIEEELEALLSSVKGAGAVDVVIFWDGTGTDHYAYDSEIKESVSDDGISDYSENRQMVLLDGDGAPVLISHENAEIQGVLIVAEGAVDDRIRKDLADAASSCLGIGKHRIEITAMEVR